MRAEPGGDGADAQARRRDPGARVRARVGAPRARRRQARAAVDTCVHTHERAYIYTIIYKFYACFVKSSLCKT